MDTSTRVESSGHAELTGWKEVVQGWESVDPREGAWAALSPKERSAWKDWFIGAVQEGGRFWDESLRRVVLRGAQLEGVDLEGVVLRGVDLSRANLRGAKLDRAVLAMASLQGAELSECSFKSADLRGADLRWSRIDGAFFQRAKLSQGSNLSRIKGCEANFSRADLEGAYFSGAYLPKVIFTRANLRRAHLPSAKLDLGIFDYIEAEGVNLEGASFERARFNHPQLVGARFGGGSGRSARFEGGDLSRTNFSRCKLQECDFFSPGLGGSNFYQADLSCARFVKCDLTVASLTEAVLHGATLDRCEWVTESVRVTALGAPILPAGLPWHPAHEFRGLSPGELRRMSDAQLVRDGWERARRSWLSNLTFRAWGVTSGYGHSVTRWLLWCGLVVLVFAFGLCCWSDGVSGAEALQVTDEKVASAAQFSCVQCENSTAGRSSLFCARCNPQKLSRSLRSSTLIFLSLGGSWGAVNDGFLEAVILIEVLCGYVMLGVLVSILAVRLVIRA